MGGAIAEMLVVFEGSSAHGAKPSKRDLDYPPQAAA
jgi:hypothetical protein